MSNEYEKNKEIEKRIEKLKELITLIPSGPIYNALGLAMTLIIDLKNKIESLESDNWHIINYGCGHHEK